MVFILVKHSFQDALIIFLQEINPKHVVHSYVCMYFSSVFGKTGTSNTEIPM